MNKREIQQLLSLWKSTLRLGFNNSNDIVDEIRKRDPQKKIHRTTGPPVIYDRLTFHSQIGLQAQLCKLMPEHIEIINSEPALTGHDWPIKDYVELYYNHYNLVVTKLKEILCNVAC